MGDAPSTLPNAWTVGYTTYVLPPIRPVPEPEFVVRLT